MKAVKIKITLILLLSSFEVLSQNVNSIQAKGRAYKDSICIRFAPTSFQVWQHTSKSGYTIERFTISKNGIINSNKEKKTLYKSLKPLPEMQWKAIAKNDKYAAIYAAALYSKSFEVQGSQTAPGNLSNQITINENRYSFALYSADMSKNTAIAAGLMITDKNTTVGEKYLYKVYPSDILKGVRIDTGYVFISPDEIIPLTKPRDLKAEWGDKNVLLTWDIRYDRGIFTTYEIERSEDNKSFRKTHDTPISNLYSEGQDLNRFYRLDSVPQNDKTYIYRVRGINSFGERGPYSDTIRGFAQEPITIPMPGVYAAKAETKGIKVQWRYPDSLNAKIKGFKVLRAPDINDKNPEVISSLLPTSNREFVDSKPKRKSFYYVQAIDQKGRPATSFPLLGHIIDSIPPPAPKGIKGYIDSSGVMRIQWNPVNEEDVKGYRVFYANRPQDEFTQLTSKAVADTFFIDTVSIKTIQSSLYIKLVTIDENFNPSEFSKILEVKRPDLIAPLSPQFTSFSSQEKGILMNWINSSSRDVVLHVIYKRKQGESKWTTIGKIDTSQHRTSFLDESAIKGEQYEYLIIAVDDAGLESVPSKIIPYSLLDDGRRPAVEKLRASQDLGSNSVILSWAYSDKSIKRFFIYRAEKGKSFRFYAKVDAMNFKDSNEIKIGTTYVYKVCAVYPSGLQSDYSKELEVIW